MKQCFRTGVRFSSSPPNDNVIYTQVDKKKNSKERKIRSLLFFYVKNYLILKLYLQILYY